MDKEVLYEEGREMAVSAQCSQDDGPLLES